MKTSNEKYILGKNKELKKIVLTGGPGAGKTTALPYCIECLLSAGFEVVVISEGATAVMNSGISVKSNVVDAIEFQRSIMKYQLLWENMAQSISYKTDRPLVLLLDRCMIDNKAYITKDEWEKLIAEFNLSELEIFSRYDMIVHLVTAAYGAEYAYSCDNNIQRGEKTIEEARKTEDNIKSAYYGHINIRYIDNSTDFEMKKQRVVNSIFEYLNLAIPSIWQRKYIVDKENFLNIINKFNPQYRDIEQTYLLSSDSNIERRIRKIGLDGQYAYYYTVKYRDNSIGTKEQSITYEMYNLLLKEADKTRSTIKKRRYYFSKDYIYYTVDDFEESKNKLILEARISDKNTNIEFKEYDGTFDEVTDDKNYLNYNISKRFPKELR